MDLTGPTITAVPEAKTSLTLPYSKASIVSSTVIFFSETLNLFISLASFYFLLFIFCKGNVVFV